jgi:Putative MetA-pathway of phenol degradation
LFKIFSVIITTVMILTMTPAAAHGPIFSPGPETLYKDGFEVQAAYHRSKNAETTEDELAMGIAYGITQDWQIEIELPYLNINENGSAKSGTGDILLETKYRLWRNNTFGKQDSVTGFLQIVLDTAKKMSNPSLSSGANDLIAGLAYGQESLIWQRWASFRFRYNGKSNTGVERGNQLFADASIGWRSEPPQYYESDTLWMVEFNAEQTQRSQINNAGLTNTGGTELFISPGAIWAYRNIALKGGIQLPIYSDLNGTQKASNYRLKFTLDINY